MEAGKIKLEFIPFDLRKLVEPIVAAHQVAAKKKNLELRTKFEGYQEGILVGDPTRIRCACAYPLLHPPFVDNCRDCLCSQILYNALSNALKFTHKGWIEIIVTSSVRPLTLELVENPNELNVQIDVTLCVSDTGMFRLDTNRACF
jgi:signal transduction histidine kinase